VSGAEPAVLLPHGQPGSAADCGRVVAALEGSAREAGLARIAAPTRILVGTRDRIVPPDAARKLAEQSPGARLVEARGGHLLPQQQPVAETIGDVLEASRQSHPAQPGMHPLTAF
jgi:pimeloyl-ACP methyl ester carboxylesterase